MQLLPGDSDEIIPDKDYGSLDNPDWTSPETIDNEDPQSWEEIDDEDEEDHEELRRSLLERVNDMDLPIDADKGYKATRLSICSFRRPHMRAFHGSWMCFCCAWLLWFSMAPLLSVMQRTSIPMTNSQIWTGNLCALVGTIFVRILLGPLCDEYGGKDTLTMLLGACALPCLFSGIFIQNYTSLVIVRSLIGCVGGTLVPVQFWVASHFSPEISGLAMAAAAGWGALGGGIAQVFMGSFLFPLLCRLLNGNEDLAWRLALVVPGALALAVAYFYYTYADDCPLGSYKQARAAGLLQQKSAVDSFRQGALNLNAWILFVQFGAQLGVELVCESGLTMHLASRFELSSSHAAAVASLFGLMNLWARACGGFSSDRLHKAFGLKGRLYLQMILLLLEGGLILLFIRPNNSLQSTVLWMVAFAAAGQMAMGCCFGIVPYVDPRCTGTIAGIVAAGGNLGGVFLSNKFRTAVSDLESFHTMAYFCIAAALLTPLIVISGHEGIIWGKEKAPGVLLTPGVLRK